MKPTRCDATPCVQSLPEAPANGVAAELVAEPTASWEGGLPGHELLAQLARDNQAAFEALRRQVIENFLACAPARHQRRLRGLQFRVDCERRLAHTALGATVRIYGMMWESFHALNQHWQEVVRAVDPHGNPTVSERGWPQVREERSAQILEFRLPPVGDTDPK